MLLPSRRRRGSYPVVSTPRSSGLVRTVVGVVLVAAVLYIVGGWFLSFLGAGNEIRRTATTVDLDDRGAVTVSLEGEEEQRAQDGMKLYPGDSLATGPQSRALLTFFDSSALRLEQGTHLAITEAAMGEKQSELGVELKDGMIWISVTDEKAFSGNILRFVETPIASYTLSPRTEALITPRSLVVYAADGPGILVEVKGRTEILIGEGQQWRLPAEGEVAADLYDYRSLLRPSTAEFAFTEESRRSVRRGASGGGQPALGGSMSGSLLTVSSPAEGASIETPTVRITGRVGEGVMQVRTNGYQAALDPATGTFTQELSLPDQSEVTIHIEALDALGMPIEQMTRKVTRVLATLEPATISSPAKNGETYRTSQTELIIRGEAPDRAAGIIVNDYRLQLFSPEKGTWSYLASIALGNMKQGTNTYDVVAIDAAGKKSDPVRLTIIVGEGTEGVVSSAPSAGASSSVSLATNDPLTPGVLTVIGPTAGTAHTATGSSLLIEGTTSAGTDSIWVNDYRLQLYVAGKTTWNYIADAELLTLKRGKNTYTIVARDAEGKILDKFEYTVTYTP
ncbi:MAG: hypothetical protein Q7R81_00080 [Candidatus Peregrinibacteria bacterium]|nr:hypothetical protein [Candidatus Peregrinibacteria bacterium]